MRNSPLKAFASPTKKVETRKSSKTQYTDSGEVDSTPVGHKKGTKAAGLSWGAAVMGGSGSAIKGEADRQATKKEYKKIKNQASKAKSVNLGGMTPTMGDA